LEWRVGSHCTELNFNRELTVTKIERVDWSDRTIGEIERSENARERMFEMVVYIGIS